MTVLIRRLEPTLRGLVIVVVVLAGIVGVLTHRNLYQDGSNFLWQSIQSRSFFSEHRHFAHWVTQLPLVVVLKLGVTKLWALSFAHGIGLDLVPFCVWASAMYVLRRHAMFWPFVAVFAATSLNSVFFSIGEYNITAACMGLSFALLLRGSFSRRSVTALMICALILIWSYEILIIGGPLLAAMTLLRIRTAKRAEVVSRFTLIGLRFCVGCYFLAAIVSLYHLIVPFDPTARGGATNFREAVTTIPQLTISIAIGTLFLLVRSRQRASQIAKVVILSGASLVLLRPSLWAKGWQNYMGRGVALTMLVVLMAVVAAQTFIDERHAADNSESFRSIGVAFLPALLLFSVQLVPLTVHSVGFHRWVHSFADFVNSNEGVVTNLEMTLEVADSYSYVSPYTNPYLSALVADDGSRAIVLSPGVEETEETTWMPDYFILPDRMYVAGSVLARW